MKKLILLILLCSPIINAQNWGEQILNHPDVAVGKNFGASVDIDGDYAIVGSPMDNNQTGSASIYKKDINGVWNHHQKLEAYVGKRENEYFGWSVAIQGEYVFISSLMDRLNEVLFQTPTGSVMIYKKDANDVWTGIQRLRASNNGHSDNFGSDIAVEGNHLFIGARYHLLDSNNQNSLSGAGAVFIYQFDQNDNLWHETQKITPSHRKLSDHFGSSLSISGNYIVVGSKNNTDVNNQNPFGEGSAFVFEKINGVWTEIQKLKPSIPYSGSQFGFGDVAISGDYIAVGALNHDFFENNQYYYGIVFMYKKGINGVWSVNQIVKTDLPASNFGTNISLSNNLLLISAPETTVQNSNNAYVSNVGLSYLFKKNPSNQFVLAETIKASEVIQTSNIGGGYRNSEISYNTVKIKNNQFIIGAPNSKRPGNDVNFSTGVAYISGDLNTLISQDIIWTGNLNTNWNEPENWDVNRLPNPIDNVTIPDVVNAPVVQSGQNHTINDMHNLDTVTIETYAGLTLNGNLNQENTIQIGSTESASGSFILLGNHTNVTPANTIYNRFVTGNNWHLIASPLNNVDIDDFVLNSPLAISVNNPNNRGLGFYTSNNPAWEYYQTGTVNSGNFIDGKGYAVLTSANTTLNFTGKIKATNLSNYAIQDNANGWNLIGNPYTSFLFANTDANAAENILSENIDNLDPVAANIYLWNPNTNTYNPIGNGVEPKYIAPGQGFFVKSKIGGGVININKTFQTHRGENLFLKSNPSSKIVLELTDNTLISNTTIAFKEGMTNGLDVSYDAAVFDGLPNTFSIYTQLKENYNEIPFAIQFLPENNENTTSINVGILHNQEKELSLQLKEINLEPNKYVYLEDKITNKFIDLKENNVYNFAYNPINNGVNRFVLHIQNTALSVQNSTTFHLNIYKKDANTIQINGLSDESVVTIFDINGKSILQNKKVTPNQSSVFLPKISNGIYILKITDINGNQLTKKLIF
ncbi:MAG: T9SS type A sorting domain-containing protein [Polaribacter sp.]|nr:T9SS type A sorting domain-containing protein [Polaribacter sp.]